MAEQYKILRIEDTIASISPGQIAVEATPDADLGVILWGGRDYSGTVSKWMAKDKPARFTTLGLIGPTTTGEDGLLKHDAIGNITGGQLTIEELNDLISDGPLGPAYWDRDVSGFLFPVTTSDGIVVGDGSFSTPSIAFESAPDRGLFNYDTDPGRPGIGFAIGSPNSIEARLFDNENDLDFYVPAGPLSFKIETVESFIEIISRNPYLDNFSTWYCISENQNALLRFWVEATNEDKRSELQLTALGRLPEGGGEYLRYSLIADDDTDEHQFKWYSFNGGGSPALREILRLYHDGSNTTYLENVDDGSDYAHYNFIIKHVAGASGPSGVLKMISDGSAGHGAQTWVIAGASTDPGKSGELHLESHGDNANIHLDAYGGATSANNHYYMSADGNVSNHMRCLSTGGTTDLLFESKKDSDNIGLLDLYVDPASQALVKLESFSGQDALMNITTKTTNFGKHSAVNIVSQALGSSGGYAAATVEAILPGEDTNRAVCDLYASHEDPIYANLKAIGNVSGDPAEVNIVAEAVSATANINIDADTNIDINAGSGITIDAGLSNISITTQTGGEIRLSGGITNPITFDIYGGPMATIPFALNATEWTGYETDFGVGTSILAALSSLYAASAPPAHNDTTSIQGGTTDQYYHLTASEHGELVASLPIGVGAVVFGGSGGELGYDSSNLVFDDTNNRLGVRQNTPLAGIHIGSGTPAIAGNDGIYATGVSEFGGQTWFVDMAFLTAGARLNDNDPLEIGNGADSILRWDTGQTNDALLLGLSGSNTLILCDKADMATDFGLGTMPTPAIAFVNSDGSHYMVIRHDGSAGNIFANDTLYFSTNGSISLITPGSIYLGSLQIDGSENITSAGTYNGVTVEGHADRHENGGADEIDVGGLSGVLADPQTVIVEDNGTPVGTRPRLNFIEGTNITLTIADDAGNDEVDITIAASGGGGVSGPVSSTDTAIVRWNGTGGDTLQDSGILINTDNDLIFPSASAAEIRWGVVRALVYSGTTLFVGQDTGADLVVTIDNEASTTHNWSLNGSDVMTLTSSGLDLQGNDILDCGNLDGYITAGASEGESTTTSSSFQQKLRVSFTATSGVRYKIEWHYEIGKAADEDVEAQVQINDSTTIGHSYFKNLPYATRYTTEAAGFYLDNTLSGTVNIDIDYRNAYGSGSAAIQRARIMITRMNS